MNEFIYIRTQSGQWLKITGGTARKRASFFEKIKWTAWTYTLDVYTPASRPDESQMVTVELK